MLPEDAVAALLRAHPRRRRRRPVPAAADRLLRRRRGRRRRGGRRRPGDCRLREPARSDGWLRQAVWSLDWHYRSKDERLIAFANRHIYDGRLVTFPSASEASAVAHVLVPAALVRRPGDSASSGGQARRRARPRARPQRPDETLGVITLGIKHADRIQASLDAPAGRPELDAFFDEASEERFFVKNLERVQGDERDAIILSDRRTARTRGRLVLPLRPAHSTRAASAAERRHHSRAQDA